MKNTNRIGPMGLSVNNVARTWWMSHVLGIWGFPPKGKVAAASR
jgi:hypothetical protein